MLPAALCKVSVQSEALIHARQRDTGTLRHMAHRWTSDYVVKWTPILTFTRRRLMLLDWFEQHIDPVAFVEDPERVGVAMVTADLRMMVARGFMIVSTGLTGGHIESLQTAMSGVFEILAPKEAILDRAFSTWSCPLPEADYNEERARLAASFGRASGGMIGGFRPVDGSALADLDSPELAGQVEWGVVTRDELFVRLSNPGLGRLSGSPRQQETDGQALRSRVEDEASDVSLLVDVSLRRKVGGQVADAGSVLLEVHDVDAAAGRVARALHDGFWYGKGDQLELA